MKIENCHPKIEDRIDLRPCPHILFVLSIVGGWFHCMLHHLGWQPPWICIDCEGCCILLRVFPETTSVSLNSECNKLKFLFTSFEFWVEPSCWDSVFLRWYVVMMYLWNSGIWASGAVWGCQWTEASIPHPSWTPPPESSSPLQSRRNLKKKTFKKENTFHLGVLGHHPPLFILHHLSQPPCQLKQLHQHCQGAFVDNLLLLIHSITQSNIFSTNYQGIWNWVCKQSWNEAYFFGESWFSGQMVPLHSPKVGKKRWRWFSVVSNPCFSARSLFGNWVQPVGEGSLFAHNDA